MARELRSALQEVVIVNDFGRINGGQAKVAIETALAIRGRGVDVSFVAGVAGFDPRLQAAGVVCIEAGSQDILSEKNRLAAAGRGLWNIRAAQILRDHLRTKDAAKTVIHVHGWAKALSPSIGQVIAQIPIPHVYTLHEYFLACPNGGFYDYRRREICHRKALGASCILRNCDARHAAHKAWRLARGAVLWSAGRMPRQLKDVIYLSPRQRDVMAPYMSADVRWYHLPNPVGPRPAERVPAEKRSRFLFIGRLSAEKGAVLAARAASEANVEIAFAGDGEEAEAVKAANPSAVMLGWLSTDAVATELAQARALVFPSLWYECYPLVLADALRLGVPVIVSDRTVADYLVLDGVSGLHVRGGDVNALASAMKRLQDDSLVQSMSDAAFAAGGELLGLEDHVTRLFGIYRSLIGPGACDERHEAVQGGIGSCC